LDLIEKLLAVAAHRLVDSGAAQVRGAAEALLFSDGPLMLFSSPWFCTTFVVPRAIYEVRLVIKPGGKLPIRTPASRRWTHISLPSCLKPPA
jgi:hypothetical protein